MTSNAAAPGSDSLHFAPTSLHCCGALGTTMVSSSRTTAWTSLLVDHDRITCSSEAFETRPTPDQTIVVMLRGEQNIEACRRGHWHGASYRAGTVGMTEAGQTDRLRRRIPASGPAPEKVVLYMPPGFFTEAMEFHRRAGQQTRSDPLVALAFDDPAIAAMAVALLAAMDAGAPDFYAETAARWIAVHLLAVHARWSPALEGPRSPGAIGDRRLQRVLALIRENVARPLTLGTLAAEAGISKFHFTRLFRQATGMTPFAYLLEQRLAATRDLLENTDDSIAVIAAKCGFPRATHFATAFGRRYGETPGACRRRHS